MSGAETDKIRAITEQYRQFKIKFIQFVKLCELVISQQRMQEIEVKRIDDAVMELKVMDAPILVRFAVLYKTDGAPLGKIDFLIHPADGKDPLYGLYFNQVGNILESVSDSFSNRRIHDEHDVPFVLHRFLQQYLRTLRLPEPAAEKKES